MSAPLTRRRIGNVLLSGAITLPAATVAARGQLSAPEPFEKLWQSYVAARAAHEATAVALDRAQCAAEAAHPERPPSLYAEIRHHLRGGSIERESIPVTVDWLEEQRELREHHIGPLPEALRALHDARVAEVRAYDEACQRIDEAHDLTALDDADDEAIVRVGAAISAIVEAPVRTLAGVLVKLRLLNDEPDHFAGKHGQEAIAGLVAAVEAMLAGQVPS
jgi:hypothetical protein